ncbi:MAG: alpha/beta hydrolase [Anaerolineales bacterium]|nr:alpha/beta hydrolase [Anaerolineales bacterium]
MKDEKFLSPMTSNSIHGKGSMLETDLGRIYYEVEGRGSPVIIVPGGPGASHTHYHPWFSRLAGRHQVVYFDPLGTGRSERRDDPRGYTLAAYAQNIEDLRLALDLASIHLIGVSFGSLPALQYLVSHTEHVDRIVLSNGHLNAATWQAGNIDNVLRELKLLYPQRYQEMMRLRSQGMLSSDPVYQGLFNELMPNLSWVDMDGHPELYSTGEPADDLNLDVYCAFIGDDPEWRVTGSLQGFDPSAQLAQITVPALILTGRYCRVTPPLISYQIRDAFPDGAARVVVFERSAHRPWAEEPEAYFRVVEEFLEEGSKR